jgi:hypothetical protein
MSKFNNWQLPQLFEAFANTPQLENFENTFGSVTDENLFGSKETLADQGWHNQFSQGLGPQLNYGLPTEEQPEQEFNTYFV